MTRRDGFTTVELMVTLFVAVLFILSGYQLYDMVSARSSSAREMAEASNIGYEVLRKEGVYKPVTSACSAPPEESVTRSDLKIPDVTITIKRCKPFADSTLIQVTVSVKYGTPQKEVVHATYLAN